MSSRAGHETRRAILTQLNPRMLELYPRGGNSRTKRVIEHYSDLQRQQDPGWKRARRLSWFRFACLCVEIVLLGAFLGMVIANPGRHQVLVLTLAGLVFASLVVEICRMRSL